MRGCNVYTELRQSTACYHGRFVQEQEGLYIERSVEKLKAAVTHTAAFPLYECKEQGVVCEG